MSLLHSLYCPGTTIFSSLSSSITSLIAVCIYTLQDEALFKIHSTTMQMKIISRKLKTSFNQRTVTDLVGGRMRQILIENFESQQKQNLHFSY